MELYVYSLSEMCNLAHFYGGTPKAIYYAAKRECNWWRNIRNCHNETFAVYDENGNPVYASSPHHNYWFNKKGRVCSIY